jgi:glycerol-3-phosphate dehydrogenase
MGDFMGQYPDYDAVIIGGGIFGCSVALEIKKQLKSVLILEQESDLLQRASYINQARVHNGYHYPRSILTALRSRINLPQFVRDYRDCVVTDCDSYYGIGKKFSKVNARQFSLFCDRIGAKLQKASQEIKKEFNPNLIEEVFQVQEYVFDAIKLKEKLIDNLNRSQIQVNHNTEVIKLQKNSNNPGKIEIIIQDKNSSTTTNLSSKYVFNCAYSNINKILKNSQLSTIPLKHELTEMALVKVPEIMKDRAITIMCGPFFSLMPFPSLGLHTLSHVRYTPHFYWQDTEKSSKIIELTELKQMVKSNYIYMLKDAQRYLSNIKNCSYVDSLWEIKTILPQSEIDDSRPILFHKHQNIPNLISILGGKIDNIYDLNQPLKFLYT